MKQTIKIADRVIGPGHPTYIIAEMSANHGQDFERAARVLRAAKDAGADAIKLQTYTADTLTIDCDNLYFRVHGTAWDGRLLYDLYREAHTPWEWHAPLQEIAHDLGLDFFSTPFDETAVDFLKRLHVPVFKVASFELVHLPLLRKIAATGKPIIASTGMATAEEIAEAVRTMRDAGARDIVLLRCTSAYPARPQDLHLRTLADLRERFGLPVGLSDHTLDEAIPAAAVALGACVIEKHLTLDRNAGGPDSGFSLEPDEFARMVQTVRTVEAALGDVQYGVKGEEDKQLLFRRSLFVVADIKAGAKFTKRNVRVIRPGHGLHPRHYDEVLGKLAAVDLARGTPLRQEHIADD